MAVLDRAQLQTVRAELGAEGPRHDAGQAERAQRLLNITPETGELLAVLVRASGARRVLEIGTSNGYSTLWLAEAALALGGGVTTLEYAAHKIALAQRNFARAGVEGCVELVQADAGAWLAASASAAFDLVFLDAERTLYGDWWPQLRRVLRPGGLLVVDNALSHAAEMAPFAALLRADAAFTCTTLPVGNGELLAVKDAQA
ncbi:O-methyltransferase [Xanthomonas sacchari]|uniref:O-methyltransferase n=1 Tax=Xanthomonas sacchari TaxID=56458 RepID=UPI0005821B36|nr:class I SAM-dependent methyltransferase [Xanthomonas sacchari]AJC46665.1 methyltransferase [Xanthomonas sacchari]